MKRLTTRGPLAAQAIRDREPFRTSGALWAGIDRPWSAGHLRGTDLAAFQRDWEGIDYVVMSYDTPIAWHHKERGWHKVSQKFSPTTSRHQGNLYLIQEAS